MELALNKLYCKQSQLKVKDSHRTHAMPIPHKKGQVQNRRFITKAIPLSNQVVCKWTPWKPKEKSLECPNQILLLFCLFWKESYMPTQNTELLFHLSIELFTETSVTSFNQKHTTELSLSKLFYRQNPTENERFTSQLSVTSSILKNQTQKSEFHHEKPFHLPSGSLRINVMKSKGEITWMPKSKKFFYSFWTERITHVNTAPTQIAEDISQQHKAQTRIKKTLH